MKKNIFILIFLILISLTASKNAYSQEVNYLRINILGLATTQFVGFGFEHNINGYSTIAINTDFGRYANDSKSEFGEELWHKQIVGFGITPAYRYYFRARVHGVNPSGWFSGLYVRYMDIKYTNNTLNATDDFSEKAFNLGGGAILGYKFKKPDSPFFFESLIGIGWGISSLTGYENDFLPKEANTWRYEFSFGYAF